MDTERLIHLLDSWNKPVVFVDTTHHIRYMNKPAMRHYSKWGDVIGKSIFDCHNQKSREIIEQAYRELIEGATEVLFVNSKKHKVFMRAVKDESGTLIGYYERYEPPDPQNESKPSNRVRDGS
jgi:DUF438 domain-containing protein